MTPTEQQVLARMQTGYTLRSRAGLHGDEFRLHRDGDTIRVPAGAALALLRNGEIEVAAQTPGWNRCDVKRYAVTKQTRQVRRLETR